MMKTLPILDFKPKQSFVFNFTAFAGLSCFIYGLFESYVNINDRLGNALQIVGAIFISMYLLVKLFYRFYPIHIRIDEKGITHTFFTSQTIYWKDVVNIRKGYYRRNEMVLFEINNPEPYKHTLMVIYQENEKGKRVPYMGFSTTGMPSDVFSQICSYWEAVKNL